MKSDQERASALAKEGFQLWEAGRLEDALLKYVEALSAADPDHDALPDYHGEFAAVLATLGRDREACEQYRISLSHALRQDPGGTGPAERAIERSPSEAKAKELRSYLAGILDGDA